MFVSRFMPCPQCGASVDRTLPEPHVCDPEALAARQLAGMQTEIDGFENLLQEWLTTPDGRLESWLALRRVRRSR